MTTTMAIDPALLANIEEHLVVDTSEREPVCLLVGRNGSHIRLTPGAIQLIRQVARGVSFERLAAALSERDARVVSPSEVESSYRRVVGEIAAIEAKEDKVRGAFWFRRSLLPASVVGRVARACSGAFHPVAAVLLLASVGAAALVGAWTFGDRAPGVADHFWPAYGLFLASLVAHEIGHAAACARHGARPSEIGLALYVVYPVFYSNVSAAWTLKRWQRVTVDVGGVYFQLVVGGAYAFALALTGWEPLAIAILFILGSCLFSLNPILKFDGYWVVADALGVTNLARQPVRILRRGLARLRGRPATPLPWSRAVTAVLALYSLAAIGFWTWFVWAVAPALWSHAVDAARVIAALFARSGSSLDGQVIREATAAAYVLLLAVLVGWRLIRTIWLGVHAGRRA